MLGPKLYLLGYECMVYGPKVHLKVLTCLFGQGLMHIYYGTYRELHDCFTGVGTSIQPQTVT